MGEYTVQDAIQRAAEIAARHAAAVLEEKIFELMASTPADDWHRIEVVYPPYDLAAGRSSAPFPRLRPRSELDGIRDVLKGGIADLWTGQYVEIHAHDGSACGRVVCLVSRPDGVWVVLDWGFWYRLDAVDDIKIVEES